MRIIIFEDQHVSSFGINPVSYIRLHRLIQFLYSTAEYKVLKKMVIPFMALTALLTRNMELGCQKNIYGKVCSAGERNNIYKGKLTIQLASQISHQPIWTVHSYP
jgi:hypothetical protein